MHLAESVQNALQQEVSLVGTVVEDRYRIESELGAGAMGAVYRGRHLKVGRTVPMTTRVAASERVVIATAGDFVFVVERFHRE